MSLMRKGKIAVVFLLLIIAAAAFYVYSSGWSLPWLGTDTATTAKVKAALALSKRVSAFDVSVRTDGGVVTLTGHVASESIKSLAGEIARDVAGVTEIKNEIVVDPLAQPAHESARVEDIEIKSAVLELFARSTELAGSNIQVKVEDRIVTLSGSAETPLQRSGAEQTSKGAQGVAGVVNNLIVTNPQAATEPPKTTAQPVDENKELAEKVEFTLFKTGAFDVQTMKVSANAGAVTLSGTVRSRAEELLAERVAQGVVGVTKVVNDLKVSPSTGRR